MENNVNSLKCPQCNLVNFATAEICKRCGGSLLKPDESNSEPEQEPLESTQPAPPEPLPGTQVESAEPLQNTQSEPQNPTLMPCPVCAHLCSKLAEACPSCGHPVRKMNRQPTISIAPPTWSATKKAISYVFVIGTFLLIGFVLYASHNHSRDSIDRSGDSPPVSVSKGEQMEWFANSVTESQCEELTRITRGPFHEMTEDEKSLAGRCYLRSEKVTSPGRWEALKAQADKEEVRR